VGVLDKDSVFQCSSPIPGCIFVCMVYEGRLSREEASMLMREHQATDMQCLKQPVNPKSVLGK
jgi:hypothetical protein